MQVRTSWSLALTHAPQLESRPIITASDRGAEGGLSSRGDSKQNENASASKRSTQSYSVQPASKTSGPNMCVGVPFGRPLGICHGSGLFLKTTSQAASFEYLE